MKKAMKYQGYSAHVEYDAEDECFIGHVAAINDVIGFHGNSVAELKQAFAEAVDDYLDVCARKGVEPKKPYSGKLLLRISPETHSAVASAAQVSGKSVNQWAAEALRKEAGLEERPD